MTKGSGCCLLLDLVEDVQDGLAELAPGDGVQGTTDIQIFRTFVADPSGVPLSPTDEVPLVLLAPLNPDVSNPERSEPSGGVLLSYRQEGRYSLVSMMFWTGSSRPKPNGSNL